MHVHLLIALVVYLLAAMVWEWVQIILIIAGHTTYSTAVYLRKPHSLHRHKRASQELNMKRNKNRFPFSDEASFRTSTEKSTWKYYKRADERNGTPMERATVKTRSSRTTDLIKTPKVAETSIIITTKPWNCQNWSGLVSDLSRPCTHYQYPLPVPSSYRTERSSQRSLPNLDRPRTITM